MKYRWDKKYLYSGITAFLVIVASILFYYLVFHSKNIKTGFSEFAEMVMPIIDGFVFAYLLTPVVNFIERNLLKPISKWNKHLTISRTKKLTRAISITMTMIIVCLFFYGFFAMIIPQLIKSIQSIAQQFPVYANNLELWSKDILNNNKDIEKFTNDMLDRYSTEINEWLNKKIVPQINVIIMQLSVGILGFLRMVWNIVIGFVISIYVLYSKELFAGQSKKIVYAFLNIENANAFIKDVRFVHKTFGGFIIGKLIGSMIIGALCFSGMSLMDLPYPVLISVIIAITDIIPFFGPYLGAVPSTILILMVNPMQALYFVIFILVLQQVEGNVLSPKILGDSTGLSGFWVLCSITLFGGLFGILGMAIGVPVFAVIYAAFKRVISIMLKKKGLDEQTKTYLLLDRIENNQYIEIEPVQKLKKSKNNDTVDPN